MDTFTFKIIFIIKFNSIIFQDLILSWKCSRKFSLELLSYLKFYSMVSFYKDVNIYIEKDQIITCFESKFKQKSQRVET